MRRTLAPHINVAHHDALGWAALLASACPCLKSGATVAQPCPRLPGSPHQGAADLYRWTHPIDCTRTCPAAVVRMVASPLRD